MPDLRSKALESVREVPVLQILFDGVVELLTGVIRHGRRFVHTSALDRGWRLH